MNEKEEIIFYDTLIESIVVQKNLSVKSFLNLLDHLYPEDTESKKILRQEFLDHINGLCRKACRIVNKLSQSSNG